MIFLANKKSLSTIVVAWYSTCLTIFWLWIHAVQFQGKLQIISEISTFFIVILSKTDLIKQEISFIILNDRSKTRWCNMFPIGSLSLMRFWLLYLKRCQTMLWCHRTEFYSLLSLKIHLFSLSWKTARTMHEINCKLQHDSIALHLIGDKQTTKSHDLGSLCLTRFLWRAGN